MKKRKTKRQLTWPLYKKKEQLKKLAKMKNRYKRFVTWEEFKSVMNHGSNATLRFHYQHRRSCKLLTLIDETIFLDASYHLYKYKRRCPSVAASVGTFVRPLVTSCVALFFSLLFCSQ